tara:strand:+ start:9515 stop:10135 length:621 start_codon:yes stop_codon:yes gene_type:complete
MNHLKKILSNVKKGLPVIIKGFSLEALIFIIFIFGIAVYDTFVKPGELMDREILEIGESIPEFEASSTSGTITSEDLKGNWSVLYFFPKSFTPGCTTQSCSLRDGYSNFDQKNINVLGISTDNLKTQRKFKKDKELPFDLIADSDKKISQKFGVLGDLGFASRITFIVNPEGKIAYVFTSVRVGIHDQEVMEKINILSSLKEDKIS